jgi:hypothetical protein
MIRRCRLRCYSLEVGVRPYACSVWDGSVQKAGDFLHHARNSREDHRPPKQGISKHYRMQEAVEDGSFVACYAAAPPPVQVS